MASLSLKTEKFLRKALDVHVDSPYDYSQAIYSGAHEHVIIVCTIEGHGIFTPTASNHVNNRSGCPKCGDLITRGKLQTPIHTFIERGREIHGKDRYDYSQVVYVNQDTNVIILCKVEGHGSFHQRPANHVRRKSGCPKCGDVIIQRKLRTPQHIFIENASRVHGTLYDYSKVEYVNARTNVVIICSKHGEFKQSPYHHINRKHCCPSCLYKTAGSIGVLLNGLYDNVEKEERFDWLRNPTTGYHLPCDFIVNGKVCVEPDGAQHFRQRKGWAPLQICQDRDKLKTSLLLEHGFHVIRVEQEFYAADSETQGKNLVEIVNACLMDEVPKLHIIASSDSMYDYLR